MDNQIKILIEAGLTENEAKVYMCLLRKQQFTATEISQCAKVNRSKIYSVLDSLSNKGLCSEKLGKVRKYEAVNPEIGFRAIIENERDKLKILESIPDKMMTLFNKKLENNSPLDFIQVYNTPASIISKYDKLELQSEKFVYSFCKRPYAMADSNQINEAQLLSMKKGVVYKSIFEVEPDQKEWFVYKLSCFVENGEEIRVCEELPIKLHIFDNATVMFSMTNKINPEKNLTYLVIDHSDMAGTLITTFNCYWNSSLTVKDYAEKEKISLESVKKKYVNGKNQT